MIAGRKVELIKQDTAGNTVDWLGPRRRSWSNATKCR